MVSGDGDVLSEGSTFLVDCAVGGVAEVDDGVCGVGCDLVGAAVVGLELGGVVADDARTSAEEEVEDDVVGARRPLRLIARSVPPPHAVARVATKTPMSARARLLRVTLVTSCARVATLRSAGHVAFGPGRRRGTPQLGEVGFESKRAGAHMMRGVLVVERVRHAGIAMLTQVRVHG